MAVSLQGVRVGKSSEVHIQELTSKAEDFILSRRGKGGIDGWSVQSDNLDYSFVWSRPGKVEQRKFEVGASLVTIEHAKKLIAANLGLTDTDINLSRKQVERGGCILMRVPNATRDGQKAMFEIQALSAIDKEVETFYGELSNEGNKVVEIDERGVPIRKRGMVNDKAFGGVTLSPAQAAFLDKMMNTTATPQADLLSANTAGNITVTTTATTGDN